MSDPYVKLFSGVDYPILTANDLAKGMWRGVYEGVRGRSTRNVLGHVGSQVVGSAVGRAADRGDDSLGFDALKGNNMAVTGVVSGLVSGGIDMSMSRGGKMERFIVPVVIDLGVDQFASSIYNGNPRIL